MVGMPVTSSGRHCARSERANGPSKSSSGPTPPKASRCCRAAGWWNEPSHGSAATDVSPRTSNKPSPQQPPGCSSHQSSSSHAVSQEHEITRDSFESDSKRREAALKWAFDVWRAEGSKCHKVLSGIDLHVETSGGWRPAREARFSEGWTPQGRNLTTYLAEASAASPDCVEAAKMLVLSEAPWIPKSTPLRKEWTDFLKVVGVKDGLPLLADETVPKTGSPIYVWNSFLKTRRDEAGRTAAWVSTNSALDLLNPWTEYTRKGELWRFPGQLEHRKLSLEARRRLAELALVQAAQGDTEWARWRLGRYERWGADQNETEILTPAAAFLAKSRWMPVDEDEGRFLRPNELWATADRRRRAPRYVDRPREKLADMKIGRAHV